MVTFSRTEYYATKYIIKIYDAACFWVRCLDITYWFPVVYSVR